MFVAITVHLTIKYKLKFDWKPKQSFTFNPPFAKTNIHYENGCEYFITTDNKLTNKTIGKIKIINPIDFVREMEESK